MIAFSLDDCETRVRLVDDALVPLMPELRLRSRSLTTLIHLGDCWARVPAGSPSDAVMAAPPIKTQVLLGLPGSDGPAGQAALCRDLDQPGLDAVVNGQRSAVTGLFFAASIASAQS